MAAGVVTFKDGTAPVGTANTDTTGKATASITGASAGAHSYSAVFAPTDPTAFGASTSTAVAVTVTAPAAGTVYLNGVAGGGQTISATVASGALTLTASTTAVNLGTLALDSSNSYLVNPTAVSLNPVTITDTRAGQLGYSVSGVAVDFSAGANKINSENLGWAPAVTGTVPATVNLTPGPAVAPGNGVLVGVTSPTVQGLKASRVLATSSYDAASGKGSIGTVQVTAALTLKAPTVTLPGAYSTTLVITAI